MIAFSLWSIHVYRYGIMYMLSFALGYTILLIGQRKWWYKNYNVVDSLLKNNIDELILSIMLGVMLGWRIWHVLIYDFFYFIKNPLKIFAIQEWWMSFIGGIIGTVISIGIFFWLYHKEIFKKSIKEFISFVLSVLDSFIFLVPIGIFFGRFGNFLNQELYGVIVPSDFRWLPYSLVQILIDTHFFHVYDKVWTMLRINTNFLSMAFEWLVLASVLRFFFFRYRISKKWSAWQLSAVFLWWYSIIRFMLEYLRQDSQSEFVWLFTKSQWFFILFIIIALGVFILQSKKKV